MSLIHYLDQRGPFQRGSTLHWYKQMRERLPKNIIIKQKMITITRYLLSTMSACYKKIWDTLKHINYIIFFIVYFNTSESWLLNELLFAMVRQTLVGVYRISPDLYREKFYWRSLENCDVTILIFVVVCSYRLFINYDNDASGRQR